MRRVIIELLLSDCPQDCLTCEKCGEGDLQKYAYELGVKKSEYIGQPISVEPVQDGPAIVYDRSKCILCGRCVEVCQNIQVDGAIDFLGRGFDTRIGLPPGLPRDPMGKSRCRPPQATILQGRCFPSAGTALKAEMPSA